MFTCTQQTCFLSSSNCKSQNVNQSLQVASERETKTMSLRQYGPLARGLCRLEIPARHAVSTVAGAAAASFSCSWTPCSCSWTPRTFPGATTTPSTPSTPSIVFPTSPVLPTCVGAILYIYIYIYIGKKMPLGRTAPRLCGWTAPQPPKCLVGRLA